MLSVLCFCYAFNHWCIQVVYFCTIWWNGPMPFGDKFINKTQWVFLGMWTQSKKTTEYDRKHPQSYELFEDTNTIWQAAVLHGWTAKLHKKNTRRLQSEVMLTLNHYLLPFIFFCCMNITKGRTLLTSDNINIVRNEQHVKTIQVD